MLCYKCKGSAAPVGPGTAQGLSLGRKIVTCDYCPLSWHLDCLEPPAAVMPTSQRKWMCPNHAAQVMVGPLQSLWWALLTRARISCSLKSGS